MRTRPYLLRETEGVLDPSKDLNKVKINRNSLGLTMDFCKDMGEVLSAVSNITRPQVGDVPFVVESSPF